MSGVDLLVVLLAFAAGALTCTALRRSAHSRRANSGRAPFVRIERIHRRSIDGGKAYYADLAFQVEVQDVIVTVEIFRADPGGTIGERSFTRWRLDTPLERPRCSDGTVETIQLIEARKGRQADSGSRRLLVGGREVESSTHLVASAPPVGIAFKVRLKVSAANRVPFVDEQFFRLAEEDLSHLPEPKIRALNPSAPGATVNA